MGERAGKSPLRNIKGSPEEIFSGQTTIDELVGVYRRMTDQEMMYSSELVEKPASGPEVFRKLLLAIAPPGGTSDIAELNKWVGGWVDNLPPYAEYVPARGSGKYPAHYVFHYGLLNYAQLLAWREKTVRTELYGNMGFIEQAGLQPGERVAETIYKYWATLQVVICPHPEIADLHAKYLLGKEQEYGSYRGTNMKIDTYKLSQVMAGENPFL